MKIKNSQIILVSTTFLGVYILLAGYLSILKPIDVKIEDENQVVSETVQVTTQTAPKALSEKVENILISFQVLDKNYELKINEGANVFDVMKKLQDEKENEFSFNYKEYPSMGVFIDEINGIKGDSGKYWIYYVNNTEASVSVSKYVLKSGDIINWKQE